MGSDVGQIFPIASLHRDHSISYALVCEKEISRMGKNNGSPDLVCEKTTFLNVKLSIFSYTSVLTYNLGTEKEYSFEYQQYMFCL